MKFYILPIFLVLICAGNLGLATESPFPGVRGQVDYIARPKNLPLSSAKIKVCSTTKRISCIERITGEDGKYFVNLPVGDDTFNLYVDGVLKTSFEYRERDINLETFIVEKPAPSGGGHSNKFHKVKAAK